MKSNGRVMDIDELPKSDSLPRNTLRSSVVNNLVGVMGEPHFWPLLLNGVGITGHGREWHELLEEGRSCDGSHE